MEFEPSSGAPDWPYGRRFGTILADPPWQFQNRTGKVAPEHKRLNRYGTMTLDAICQLPVREIAAEPSHLYLWVPNALLPDGLKVMDAWGFRYVSNIIWEKVRKDGEPDGRGVGFYFRNVTELLLFGTRGKNARTLSPGRSQVNILRTRKREHSRKADEQYDLIEECSWGPRLELFARGSRSGWVGWGDQSNDYEIAWQTYRYNSEARGTRYSRVRQLRSALMHEKVALLGRVFASHFEAARTIQSGFSCHSRSLDADRRGL